MSALSGWPFPSHVVVGFPVALKLVIVLLLSATRDGNLQIETILALKLKLVSPEFQNGGIRGLKNELPFVIIIIIKYSTQWFHLQCLCDSLVMYTYLFSPVEYNIILTYMCSCISYDITYLNSVISISIRIGMGHRYNPNLLSFC